MSKNFEIKIKRGAFKETQEKFLEDNKILNENIGGMVTLGALNNPFPSRTKINEVDDDQMIKYKDSDGESKEMKADSAKKMPKDHPAKIEYDKQTDGGGDVKKGVNIFDEPADEPADEPKSGDMQAIGKNTPAQKASSPEVQHISDHFFEKNKNYEVDASDAADFALTHYKALTGDEYDFEENYFPGEVEDFMETVVGEDYDWQDDWNDAHEGHARSYDEGEFEDHSDDIPPMDEPSGDDAKSAYSSEDDAKKIHRKGARRSQDEIDKILMNDPEIADMLGDDDDFHWDGDDLVSKKYDDQTIVSIDDKHGKKTIGDLKLAIKQFTDKQRTGRSESARNIIPKGSFKQIQENWIKRNF